MRTPIQLIAAVALVAVAGGAWFAFRGENPGSRTSSAQPASGPGAGRPGPPSGVVIEEAKLGTIQDSVEAVGTARANEAIVVTAKQTGTVARINFAEGQRVKAGATLVDLDGNERRADLDNARAQRDEALQRLQRARRLQPGTMAEARVDELDAQWRGSEARLKMAEARLEDLRVAAPFDGRLGLRQVSLGALVQPGAAITTIDDISIIKVEFSVPETALGRLRIGVPVRAKNAAFRDGQFDGKVTVIDTRVDSVTRSVKVIANFDNAEETLRPGMFMNVEVALEQRTNIVLIPEEAIVPEGTRHFVFTVTDGRAQRVEVKVGARLPGRVEIVSGLSAGDKVVVRGVQKIRNGQPVAVRPGGPTS